ncbi:hypothetical protein N7461_008445 [Penicillium sp. DV-2018c]|nr:hypothetical protein N7461_008445 [Penicillium sp. DV-2018c]
MTLWSQWFPIPGLTVPQMSFKHRLAGTLRLTLESWIVCDAEDAAKSQRSYSGGIHSGDAAVVSFAGGHGYANTTDYLVISPETAVIVRPGLVDSMPSWFPTGFKVPLPDLSWYSVGVTSSVPEEVVDIHPLGPGPGQDLFVSVLLVVLWCVIQGPMALIAYSRRLVSSGVRALAEWTLDYLDGQPQIALVQFVAEKDSTLYDKLDLLIAGVMDIQDETLAWVLAVDSRPDSVSHVSVLPHSGGIWVHRIPKSSDGEQARGRKSASNTTETASGTDSVCLKLVCQHPWNPPKMDASEHDDASPSGEDRNANGADIEGDGSPRQEERDTARRRQRDAASGRGHSGRARRNMNRGFPSLLFMPLPLRVHLSRRLRARRLNWLWLRFPFLLVRRSRSCTVVLFLPLPQGTQDCGTGPHDDVSPPQRSSRRHRRR